VDLEQEEEDSLDESSFETSLERWREREVNETLKTVK